MTNNDPYRDPLHFLKGIIVFGNNEAFALCHYVVTLPNYIMEIEIFFPQKYYTADRSEVIGTALNTSKY